MGMFDSTPAQQTTGLPNWVNPYAQNFLQQASDLANKPYQPYSGQTVAPLNPYTQQGVNMQATLGANGTQVGNVGSQALSDIIAGKNMGGNPYLDQQVNAAQQDLVRNYNLATAPQMESAMVNSGSFGNSGLQQMQQAQQSDLQRNLGVVSANMRGAAYDQGLQQQTAALGMVPQFNALAFGNAQALQGAGNVLQGQQQNELTDQYNRFQDARQYPYQQLNVLGSALGHNFGGTASGTPGSASPAAQVLGGGIALGSLFSGGTDSAANGLMSGAKSAWSGIKGLFGS
jgi:hypothetical protein